MSQRKNIFLIATFLTLGFSFRSWGFGGEKNQGAGAGPSGQTMPASPGARAAGGENPGPVSLFAGAAVLLSPGSDTGVLIGADYRFLNSSWGTYAFEVSGVPPKNISDFTRIEGAPPASYEVKAIRYSEVNFALRGRWRLPKYEAIVSPTASLGVSVVHFRDQYMAYKVPTTEGGSSAASAIAGLGLHFFPAKPISVRVEATWARYANEFDANGQHFNLGYGAWTFRPVLLWTF
jgi:hypothetical protein